LDPVNGIAANRARIIKVKLTAHNFVASSPIN
jgi:hypothetical protein